MGACSVLVHQLGEYVVDDFCNFVFVALKSWATEGVDYEMSVRDGFGARHGLPFY